MSIIKIAGVTVTTGAMLGHLSTWSMLILAIAGLTAIWLSDGATRRQQHFAKQGRDVRIDMIELQRAQRDKPDVEMPKRALEGT